MTNMPRDHAELLEMTGRAEEARQFRAEQNAERERHEASIKIGVKRNERERKALAEACPDWTPAAKGDTSTLVKGFAIRCMKDIQPEPVKWLWKPYIPIGKITSVEGDPGIAKTWITLAISSAMSLGKGLPGQIPGEPCNIMMASSEDGYADTFRPRLDGMGSNLEHIFVIDDPFTFDNEGFSKLETDISDKRPKLLVIDPLQAYLGAGMDFHRANETRPVLSRLAKLAENHELAVLVVRHLSKGSAKAIYRGLGSIDFTAACRSVLLAGSDPENPAVLAIVHIKSNLAKKGPSQGYELRDDNFYWTGESTLTSGQILAGDDNSSNVSEIDEAITFLKDELADGPVSAKTVYNDAEGVGISKRTLNRAKAQLGIITRHLGEKGKRGGGDWIWELPTENNDIATKLSGNLNNFEAKKMTTPKDLATSNSEEIVPEDGPTPCLIQPREKTIKLWVSKGRPLIHLGPGENCQDLEKLLSNENILTKHIEAINKWYVNNGGN